MRGKGTLWAFFFWDSRVDSSDSSSSKTRKVLTRVGLGSIWIPTLHRAGVHHSEPLVLTAIAAKALGKWTRGSERGFTREFTCRYRRSISSIIQSSKDSTSPMSETCKIRTGQVKFRDRKPDWACKIVESRLKK